MTNSATANEVKLTQQATLIAGLLGFILIFTASAMVTMVFLALNQGRQSERLQAVAVETHDALCAFKTDLQRRHDRLERLLVDNPGPFPGRALGLPDVPRAVFQQSSNNQELTLDSLTRLVCD